MTPSSVQNVESSFLKGGIATIQFARNKRSIRTFIKGSFFACQGTDQSHISVEISDVLARLILPQAGTTFTQSPALTCSTSPWTHNILQLLHISGLNLYTCITGWRNAPLINVFILPLC